MSNFFELSQAGLSQMLLKTATDWDCMRCAAHLQKYLQEWVLNEHRMDVEEAKNAEAKK